MNEVRGLCADAVANVVAFCLCPCVSRVLVGVAVSEVVSVVSALGWVDERETRVKHRDLVANVPPLRGWRPEPVKERRFCAGRSSR